MCVCGGGGGRGAWGVGMGPEMKGYKGFWKLRVHGMHTLVNGVRVSSTDNF